MDTQVGRDGGGRRRSQLIGDRFFVTDGGIETDLIFHGGIDMPHFAAFPLLENAEHRARLRRYYDDYLAMRGIWTRAW
jgi:homocysteine S-methyltransferase